MKKVRERKWGMGIRERQRKDAQGERSREKQEHISCF